MTEQHFIALTGGPGGGKTRLIDEMQQDPAWSDRIAALPEAALMAGRIGVSPGEKLFQRMVVHLQMALQDGLAGAFVRGSSRVILCHRGSLDPLAYWLDRGWSRQAFFEFTDTTLHQHYQQYTGVIHLVTAADGAMSQYSRWPEAHRPEEVEDAIRLDRLLHRVWRDHPQYYRLDNDGRDWEAKSQAARKIIAHLVSDGYPV